MKIQKEKRSREMILLYKCTVQLRIYLSRKKRERQNFCCHGCSYYTLSIPPSMYGFKGKSIMSSGINDTARCAPTTAQITAVNFVMGQTRV